MSFIIATVRAAPSHRPPTLQLVNFTGGLVVFGGLLSSLSEQPSATRYGISFEAQPCQFNPTVEEWRRGKGGKMVIELHIKVLRV